VGETGNGVVEKAVAGLWAGSVSWQGQVVEWSVVRLPA